MRHQPSTEPAIAVVMLAASFVMLLAINLLQAWMRRRSSKVAK